VQARRQGEALAERDAQAPRNAAESRRKPEGATRRKSGRHKLGRGESQGQTGGESRRVSRQKTNCDAGWKHLAIQVGRKTGSIPWRKLRDETHSLAVARPVMEKGESRSPEVATLSRAREGKGYKEWRLSAGLQIQAAGISQRGTRYRGSRDPDGVKPPEMEGGARVDRTGRMHDSSRVWATRHGDEDGTSHQN